jgi:hypothetical protein
MLPGCCQQQGNALLHVEAFRQIERLVRSEAGHTAALSAISAVFSFSTFFFRFHVRHNCLTADTVDTYTYQHAALGRSGPPKR